MYTARIHLRARGYTSYRAVCKPAERFWLAQRTTTNLLDVTCRACENRMEQMMEETKQAKWITQLVAIAKDHGADITSLTSSTGQGESLVADVVAAGGELDKRWSQKPSGLWVGEDSTITIDGVMVYARSALRRATAKEIQEWADKAKAGLHKAVAA